MSRAAPDLGWHLLHAAGVALPLAESVPIMDAKGRRGIVVIVLRGELTPGGEGCGVCWDGHGYDGHKITDSVDLRVNLNHPQGFGYALRWLNMRVEARSINHIETATGKYYTTWMNGLTGRHLHEFTTDTDRLDLAKACAVVKS